MKVLGALFGLAAMGLAVVGLSLLSNATTGVGVIGLAAIAAIFARLFQADAHHAETTKRFSDLSKTVLESLYRLERSLDPDRTKLQASYEIEQKAARDKEQAEAALKAQQVHGKQLAKAEAEQRKQEKAIASSKDKAICKHAAENEKIRQSLRKKIDRFKKLGGDIEEKRQLENDYSLATSKSAVECVACGTEFEIVGLLTEMQHTCPNCGETLMVA